MFMRSLPAPAFSRARTAAFLLTAVLLLALSLGAGRAAADDPNMNGGDGRTVAQAFDAAGNLYMVSQTPAHGLAVTVNYASNNSWNGPLINYVPTNNVYSTPAMLFDTDGTLFIAYQGPGRTLMVMSRWASDNQWHGPFQIEGVNSVYSTPSIVKAPWGDIFVTYQGPSNSLVTSVRQSSDSTWHKYPIVGAGTTYSSPAQRFVTYADGAHLLISAVGVDRRLVVTDRYVDGTWHGPYSMSGTNAAYSAPNMVTGKDGTLRIAFEGPGHSYSEITKTTTAWAGPVTRAGGTVFSAPSQLVDSAGNIYAAWQGPNHSLNEFVRYAIDGSWNGPYNLVNANDTTYWAPTQIYNTTTGRITISMQGTNNKLVTLINGTSWTKLENQIGNNVSTGDIYWRTSALYGGEFDGHVNTTAEANAVADAYQGAASHTAARQLLAELDPADLPLVEFSLRNSIQEGDLVINMDNDYVYVFTGFKLHYLNYSIGHDILKADAEMAAAKRVTGNSLSTITEGAPVAPYKTSWDYGGLDRSINTTAEAQVVVAAILASGVDPNVSPVRAGVAPGDLFLVDAVLADAMSDANDVYEEQGTSFTFPSNIDDDVVHRVNNSGTTGSGSTTSLDSLGHISTLSHGVSPLPGSADPCQFSNPNRAGFVVHEPKRLYREKIQKYSYQTVFITARQTKGITYVDSNGATVAHKRYFACATGSARPIDTDNQRVLGYAQKLIYTDINAILIGWAWGTNHNDGQTITLNFGVAGGPLTAGVSVPVHVGGFRGGTLGDYYTPWTWSLYKPNQVSGFWRADGSPSRDSQGQTTMAIWDVRSSEPERTIEVRDQAYFGKTCKSICF